MLFEQCPRLYRDRYIDGIATTPSLPMLFGSAVHTALEAYHQGHRGVCLDGEAAEDHYDLARAVYQEKYDEMAVRLTELGLVAPAALYADGLWAIEAVAGLNLNADGRSTPERWFRLPTEATGLASPTIGAVDLWSQPWSQHGPVIWDFKTTAGSWGPDRAQRETWQPMLYTWAYRRAYDVIPVFKYVVLNRLTRTMQVFERSWSKVTWTADLRLVKTKAAAIVDAVQDGDFECAKRHGNCLECGRPFGHDHVCAEGSRPTKVKLVKTAVGTFVQPVLDLA
jgi:hypothetical protein